MTVARAAANGHTRGVIRASLASALAAALAGCGITGTITLELVAAPDSTLPSEIQRARLTLSDPERVVEVTRAGDGRISLELDVVADGRRADLVLEGFDAAGARIAYGRTPTLELGAFDGTLAIYVAAPGSLAPAPVPLDPPRRAIGPAAFPFGVLVAGGIEADGAVSDELRIYSIVTHRFTPDPSDAGAAGDAIAMPAPRAGVAIGGSGSGYAYFFGGSDGVGAPTGTAWQFDTTIAPRGAWREAEALPAQARTGAAMTLVATEAFVVTGAPPIVIDGLSLTVAPATTIASLAGTATSNLFVDTAGRQTVYGTFVGEGSGATGVVRVTAEGLAELPAPPSASRTGHGAGPSRDGRTLVIGGAVGGTPVRGALMITPRGGTIEVVDDVLATARTGAAVAVSGGRLVVAGGVDAGGAIVPTAEIFDDLTLTPLGVVPMVVPRTGAVARPLANGQVAIFGGVDETGAPIGTIELYTPDP